MCEDMKKRWWKYLIMDEEITQIFGNLYQIEKCMISVYMTRMVFSSFDWGILSLTSTFCRVDMVLLIFSLCGKYPKTLQKPNQAEEKFSKTVSQISFIKYLHKL